jgi:zinc transport system permease protein
VGVLLVSALLIVPAASALQVGRSFRAAVLLSMLLGVASVVVGLYVAVDRGFATGATVALTSTLVFAVIVLAKRVLTARAAS